MQLLLTLAIAIFHSSYSFKYPQYFVVPPSNVTVVQDADTFIRCVVGYQATVGSTWWTKDGGTLGFEKSLPGYPRYQVVGNETLGEYNLQITQAQLEDDAQYQCQVPPGPHDDGLRGIAYVNVLVPPNKLTFDGFQDGARKEIRAGTTLDVSCKANGAKPAAQLLWYRNGVSIPDKHYEVRQIPEDDGKRFTTISRLRWTALAEHNNDIFTCESVHAALVHTKRIRIRFTVSVIYPPGMPAISGYTSGRALLAGDSLTLQCVVENGNPLPEVIWYRNSVSVGRNYVAADTGYTRNDYKFQVHPSDNEAEYRCEASNSATHSPSSQSIRLKVYFPPDKVEISGPDHARIRDTVQYTCKTSASYPDARLEWIVDGRPYLDHAQKNWASRVDMGTESSSSITLKVDQHRPELIVVCKAINDQAHKRETTSRKVVTISYPPDSIRIEVLGGERVLSAGEKISLGCLAIGGNPPATIEWFRNERKITNGIRPKYDASLNATISEVEFTLKSTDNQGKIECRAFNHASDERISAAYVLNVQFPPDSLRISPNPVEILSGDRSELNCVNAPANPSPTIEWYRDGRLLTSVTAHNKTDSSGTVVKKKLIILPSLQDDGAIYECRAMSPLLANPISEKITLLVHHKPIFLLPTSQTVEVLEGETVSLNLSAYANPPVEKYVWYKDQTSSHLQSMPPRISVNGPNVEITNVDRDDAGTYTCKARNRHGDSSMTVKIIVKYPAHISNISPLTYANLGENVSLTCKVDAVPMTSGIAKWKRVTGNTFYDENRFVETIVDGSIILTIYGVRKEDTGEYICSASNGLGVATFKKTALLVRQEPVMDKSSLYVKAAASLGKDASLTCLADGVPDIKFSWHRQNMSSRDGNRRASSSPISENDRISFSLEKIGLTRYMSHMTIKKVHEADYGTYRCIVENELGSRSVDVKFGPPEPPDQPLGVYVTNRTHDSVTVVWQPGYSGGLDQQFRVRYRLLGVGIKESPTIQNHVIHGTKLTLDGLKSKSSYSVAIQAFNDKGSSGFTNLTFETLALSSVIQESVKDEFPLLIIVLISLVGVILLLVNLGLVVCFLRRHRRKKLEERATNARLGSVSTGRKIQMYSTETGAVSKVMYQQTDKDAVVVDDQRPRSVISESGVSLRTVIEADGTQTTYIVAGSPPAAHARHLLDTTNDVCESGTPNDLSYAEALRSNSLQRNLSNGVYNVPEATIRYPTLQDHNINTYVAGQVVDDVLPPPPRSLQRLAKMGYNSNAYYATIANKQDRRYSPTHSYQSYGTPYAEVKPLLNNAGPIDAIPAYASPVRNVNRANAASSNFSTFAALPLRTKMQAEYDDEIDSSSGDLV